MKHSNWTEADSHKAKQIWEAYQKQYNLSERIGQTVGIDPKQKGEVHSPRLTSQITFTLTYHISHIHYS